MDAGLLSQWWDIAQVAGAGAAVVLGPIVVLFWRRMNSDTEYIRQSEKASLAILSELTSTLKERNGATNHDVIQAIDQAVSSLKDFIAARHRN